MVLRVIRVAGEIRVRTGRTAETVEAEPRARSEVPRVSGHTPRRVGSGRPVRPRLERRRPNWTHLLVAALPLAR